MIAYAFSWLFWVPQALAARGAALPAGLVAFLGSPLNPAAFGPLVSALVLALSDGGWRGVLDLLKRGVDVRFRKVWLFPTLLLPPVVFAGASSWQCCRGRHRWTSRCSPIRPCW